METAVIGKPQLAADVLADKQAKAAEQRETVFNLQLAERLAAKIVRRGLKGFDKLRGRSKPERADEIKALKAKGLKRKAICGLLGIDGKEYSRAVSYWKASLAERETVETPSHCSIVGDVVNMAYLLWVENNYLNWQARCDKKNGKGEIAEPYSTAACVGYAHGNYWKPSRKPESRRQREESDIVAHSGLRAAGAKGSARTMVTDLSDELGDKAKQVARLLSTGSSAADVADMLKVSRPTVSVHCKKIRESLELFERFAALEPSPIRDNNVSRADFWRIRDKQEKLEILSEVFEQVLLPSFDIKPLAARIRANVAASRAARLACYRPAVSLTAKPQTALGEYAIAAARQTVAYSRRLESLGLAADGSPIVSMETKQAAEQAANLLANLPSREPSAARKQAADVATLRELLPQFFNVETETDKQAAERRAACYLAAEERKAQEIAARNVAKFAKA